jgi:hypothetical protein
VKAGISNILNISSELAPNPKLVITPGHLSINVQILETGAEQTGFYKVYWKKGETVGDDENIETDPLWKSEIVQGSEFTIIDSFVDNAGSITEDLLEAENKYMVVVKAFTNFTESERVVRGPIVPFSKLTPEVPQYIIAKYNEKNSSIVVNNIFVEGQIRYKIRYRTVDSSNWVYHPIISNQFLTTENTSEIHDPVNLPLLSPWKAHEIEVWAVTGNGTEGDRWSKTIEGVPQLPPDAIFEEETMTMVISDFYTGNDEKFDIIIYDLDIDPETGIDLADNEKVKSEESLRITYPFDRGHEYLVTLSDKPGSFYYDPDNNRQITLGPVSAGTISLDTDTFYVVPDWKTKRKRRSVPVYRRVFGIPYIYDYIYDGWHYYGLPFLTIDSFPSEFSNFMNPVYKIYGIAEWGELGDNGDYNPESYHKKALDSSWGSLNVTRIRFNITSNGIIGIIPFNNVDGENSFVQSLWVSSKKRYLGYVDEENNTYPEYPNLKFTFTIRYIENYDGDPNASHDYESPEFEVTFGSPF